MAKRASIETRLQDLPNTWDAVVIGGGITGAGIFEALSKQGYEVLLLEQADYAFGTSSRSSKLVHGGLRYLANAQYHVTYESVREREKLQTLFPHLVKPLEFILPVYEHYKGGPSIFKTAITIYDIFGSKWRHGGYTHSEIQDISPYLQKQGLQQSLYYYDAEVDDSRLVYRIIRDGIHAGGTALNYVKVEDILKDKHGDVAAVQVRDVQFDKEKEIRAGVFINATGPWTDELRSKLINQRVIRKLRGSHLIFQRADLPVDRAFTLFHPIDGRALFVIPWQGMTMVGTTDLDHPSSFEQMQPEPFITIKEMDYLLDAANTVFPGVDLTPEHIVSTFSGLRPIVTMGTISPSKASRAHKIFSDGNFFSIAGGKLTTYRRMAKDMIRHVKPYLPSRKSSSNKTTKIIPNIPTFLDTSLADHFMGIYGDDAVKFMAELTPTTIETYSGTQVTRAELLWALKHEDIFHLDDLLLRRTRLGLFLPDGAVSIIDSLKTTIQHETGWDEKTWKKERERYQNLWRNCYSIPMV